MAEFARERLVDCFLDISFMAALHHEEIQPHDLPFAPHMATYQKLEEVGALHICTVRVDRSLAGYALAIVMPNHLHHSVKWASCDGVFIRRDCRRPRIADRLLTFMEDGLRAEGVVLTVIGEAIGHPALGRLLAKRGYAAYGTLHSRKL